jgi:hypothetical protein
MQAFARARALDNGYLTFGALRAVAEAQRALGLAEAAAETERLALKAALTGPDPKRHDYDLGRLAAEQAPAGDFEAALRTAELIEEPPARTSATLEVERAEATAGRSAEALALVPELDAGFPHDGALIAASEAQTRAGDFAAALAALEPVTDRSLRVRLLEELAGTMTK